MLHHMYSSPETNLYLLNCKPVLAEVWIDTY